MSIFDFRLPIIAALLSASVATAQESPSPTSSPTPAQTPSPSPSIARSVRISFVPPPMEGTISLGIFDADRKLVRVLHREAKIDKFTIEDTSLTTTWDGKDDAGEDLPSGKYHARGYMVGDLKIEEIAPTAERVVVLNGPPSVPVKLIVNPLISDTRSVVEIAVGSDQQSIYLKTTDGLPLQTIVRIEKSKGDLFLMQQLDKSLTAFLFRPEQTPREFHIGGASKMMAFDCGDFELK